jgi:hypothetical protein
MSSIPNLNGQKYKVIEKYVQSGIQKYNSPDSKTYVCEFKQKERFVSSVDAKKNECLGIWHNSGNGWQLHISIDKNDNDTFILTPTKILENNDYSIVLLEDYPCETKDQLLARERYYIENNICVNKIITTRTPKEYREKNKDKLQKLSVKEDSDRVKSIDGLLFRMNSWADSVNKLIQENKK